MFSSNKLAVNRTSREIGREIRRLICKTTSAPNSDAISRQDNKRVMNNVECNSVSNKWSTLSRHNNMRALSTIQTKVAPPVPSAPVFSKEESREFMAIFPDIVRDLTDAGRHTDIPEVTKRFAKMLEKPENLTPENVRLAGILGWCVELFVPAESEPREILENNIVVIVGEDLLVPPLVSMDFIFFSACALSFSTLPGLGCSSSKGTSISPPRVPQLSLTRIEYDNDADGALTLRH
ncbi:unnamed protein product [Phaedon cochleariae]|uniref:Uncharacterized protein n=1 Tax=Phaedon cochleariae TaxID=80249 RepID=A0A9N9WZY0_PHACE|nr:unnamed protein product [Phaedon cochleariae]